MVRATKILGVLGLAVLPLLQACSSDSAKTFSAEISAAANGLAGSTASEVTLQIKPPVKAPYMVIIYPDSRSDEDKELLKALVEQAAMWAPKAAPMVPTLDGLKGTMVIWQKGSLVRYANGWRSVARTKKVLVTIKEDGGATTVRLKREGGLVYVDDIQ